MISMNNSRFDSKFQHDAAKNSDAAINDGQLKQFGTELVSRARSLAVEKPLVVVVAGLAVGVLSGFLVKRR